MEDIIPVEISQRTANLKKLAEMYHVRWMPNELQMVSRWFTNRDAALAFAKRCKVAVVFDPQGIQI